METAILREEVEAYGLVWAIGAELGIVAESALALELKAPSGLVITVSKRLTEGCDLTALDAYIRELTSNNDV